MDVDPLSIFFAILRIAGAVLVIIFFFVLWNAYQQQLKTADIQKYNIELFENFANSQLAVSKYIFDPAQLDAYNGKELSFLRSCQYEYAITVSDDGGIWSFGKQPEITSSNYQFDQSQKTYYTGIYAKNPLRPENFYGTTNFSVTSVVVYDNFLGRLACSVEKAYTTKKIQETQSKSGECELGSVVADNAVCYGLRKDGGKICMTGTSQGDLSLTVNEDCKSFPTSISFQELRETPATIKASGVNIENKIKVVAYPVKAGALNTGCDQLKANPDNFVPQGNDNVGTIILCVENV